MKRFFREPLRVLEGTSEGSSGNLCAGIVSEQLLNHHVSQCCILQTNQNILMIL